MQVDSVANAYLCNERNCMNTEPTVVNSYNSPAVAKTYTAYKLDPLVPVSHGKTKLWSFVL